MSQLNHLILPNFRLVRFIDLILRQNDYIELPLEEAILIDCIDKEKSLCYVEFPNKLNTISKPRLWNLSAWRISQEKHEQARVKAEKDRKEFDNYKINLNLIAEKLSRLTSMQVTDLFDTAKPILRQVKDGENWMDIRLHHPFYRGDYVILPCRNNNY